jgi:exportin-T
LQERAAAFVDEIKRSPDVWRLCAERFSVTAFQEVKFWCLQTLHEVNEFRAEGSSLQT